MQAWKSRVVDDFACEGKWADRASSVTFSRRFARWFDGLPSESNDGKGTRGAALFPVATS